MKKSFIVTIVLGVLFLVSLFIPVCPIIVRVALGVAVAIMLLQGTGFFEGHDITKIALFMIGLTIILSWTVKQGYFSSGELVSNDITRIGIFDMTTYGLLGIYYFTVIVTFMFVLGAFYQFLSKLGAYQKLTDSISKKFKGKEILFSLITSFLLAAFASVFNEYLVVIAFVPFFITLCTKLNMNKISTFVTTFGSVLVGIMASVLGSKIVGMNAQFFNVGYDKNVLEKVLLFVLAWIVYSLFNILYLKKATSKSSKKSSEEAKTLDIFESEAKDSKKSNPLALIIVLSLVLVITILAYLPWESVFNVDWFNKALTTINETKLFGVTIFNFILGNVGAFGAWDLFGIQSIMLIAIVILQICYKVSIDDTIEAFKDGFKKVGKLVIVLLLAYVVLEFAVMYPVIPTIVAGVLGKTYNVFTTAIAGLTTGLFTSEYQYAANILTTFVADKYASNINAVSFILQSTHGLIAFLAPSSALLLVGLRYLEIPYKDWIKYIWKFLVAVLVLIIVIALLLVK